MTGSPREISLEELLAARPERDAGFEPPVKRDLLGKQVVPTCVKDEEIVPVFFQHMRAWSVSQSTDEVVNFNWSETNSPLSHR
jgi:hypothetical protein